MDSRSLRPCAPRGTCVRHRQTPSQPRLMPRFSLYSSIEAQGGKCGTFFASKCVRTLLAKVLQDNTEADKFAVADLFHAPIAENSPV